MSPRARIAFLVGLVLSLAVGWLLFPRLLYVQAQQPLPFNHQLHTEQGLACEDCHAFRADGSFVGVPPIAVCAGCHAEPVGSTAGEKQLVEDYVKPGLEIPWRVYARQPDNVHFPHAAHVKRGALSCERCHGPHGTSATLRPYESNRVSGYSRDIWGPRLLRVGGQPWQGMKMSDCVACHAAQGQGGTACLACHK
jgi:menaquinone reductase, multiheme cytochrome c subunit